MFKAVSYVYACVCRFYKVRLSNSRSGKYDGVVSVKKHATKDAYLIIRSQKMLRKVAPDFLDLRAVVPASARTVTHSLH